MGESGDTWASGAAGTKPAPLLGVGDPTHDLGVCDEQVEDVHGDFLGFWVHRSVRHKRPLAGGSVASALCPERPRHCGRLRPRRNDVDESAGETPTMEVTVLLPAGQEPMPKVAPVSVGSLAHRVQAEASWPAWLRHADGGEPQAGRLSLNGRCRVWRPRGRARRAVRRVAASATRRSISVWARAMLRWWFMTTPSGGRVVAACEEVLSRARVWRVGEEAARGCGLRPTASRPIDGVLAQPGSGSRTLIRPPCPGEEMTSSCAPAVCARSRMVPMPR